MGIKRVTTPTGQVRYEVRTIVGGVEHRRRCRAREDAKAVLAELRQQARDLSAKDRLDAHLQRLGLPSLHPITLGELIAKVLDSPDFKLRPDRSTARDRYAWWHLVSFFGEDLPVHTITTERLEALRRQMLEPFEHAAYHRTYRPV